MRTERKAGALVEVFKSKMVTCEIRFDKNRSGGTFTAEHATKEFVDPTLPGLKAQLKKHADTYAPLTWERVIVVHVGWTDEARHHNSISAAKGETRTVRELHVNWTQIERAHRDGEYWFVRTAKPAPELVAKWETDPFHNVDVERFDDYGDTIIPWTPKAEESLCAICDGIEHLHRRLSELLAPTKASAFLNAGVAMGKLLGDGK